MKSLSHGELIVYWALINISLLNVLLKIKQRSDRLNKHNKKKTLFRPDIETSQWHWMWKLVTKIQNQDFLLFYFNELGSPPTAEYTVCVNMMNGPSEGSWFLSSIRQVLTSAPQVQFLKRPFPACHFSLRINVIGPEWT